MIEFFFWREATFGAFPPVFPVREPLRKLSSLRRRASSFPEELLSLPLSEGSPPRDRANFFSFANFSTVSVPFYSWSPHFQFFLPFACNGFDIGDPADLFAPPPPPPPPPPEVRVFEPQVSFAVPPKTCLCFSPKSYRPSQTYLRFLPLFKIGFVPIGTKLTIVSSPPFCVFLV